MRVKPKAVLLDFGGTLVQEVAFDLRAGNEWVLARASHRPTNATLERVMHRANEVSEALSKRRDEFQIECPWPTQSRLIHVGAKAAGMHAIWLRPEGKEIPPVHDADVIADSWTDVVELLDA
jgi:FMN phosphatase YigB (HAD superfamily)